MTINDNINHLRSRMLPHAILVAVSKTVDDARLREALAAGHRVFGENYVQEAKTKWPTLKTEFPDIKLHMIGHLQSNKADDAVALFDRIDTVDRHSLVDALAKAIKKKNRAIPCLIEVNVGGEAQKSGCAPDAVPELIDYAQKAGIEIQGLMTIPPAGIDPAPFFKQLAVLANHLNLPIISMGMSADYEIALVNGATEIRIGSGVFGARKL
jgi:PLP dependent protein